MLRSLIAVTASFAAGLLLAAIAFGKAWTGFEFGFAYAGSAVALSAGSLLTSAVIATVVLPRARVFVVVSAQMLPMLVVALMLQGPWGWMLFAAVAAAAALGAWLGPRVFGRLPASATPTADSRA
jgi:hypothetical protein